jgi:hypothetical protein
MKEEWSDWEKRHRRVRAGLALAVRGTASDIGSERVSIKKEGVRK